MYNAARWVQSTVVLLMITCAHAVSVYNFEMSPREQAMNAKKIKIVCYYPLPHVKYNTTLPRALNATLCTHLVFINSIIIDCQIQPAVQEDLHVFQNAIPIIKKQNPSLKVLLSNGGDETHSFDDTLLTASNRQKFINTSVEFLRKNWFDGLDMDWEFPGWNPKPVGQRKNFTMLLQGLRSAFEKEAIQTKRNRLLLSAAVSAVQDIMAIYDIPVLGETLDMVNMMGYDYHGYDRSWPFTGYNSPLYAASENKHYVQRNLNWSVNAWIEGGLPKEKLMMGVPVYSKAFKLLLPSLFHGHMALSDDKGQCESAAYVCTCRAKKQYNGTRVFDDKAKVPYLYYGDQWISYDDEESLALKVTFVKDHGLGGIMVFSLSADDYAGECDGVTKFPLISAIHRAVYGP